MNNLLIGYGEWGKVIFRNLNIFKTHKNIVLKRKIKSKKEFKYLEKIIKLKKINNVFLTADPYTNSEIFKFLFKLSVNIFIEKPLLLNNFKIKKLINFKNKKTIDINYLYYKEIKKIKNLNINDFDKIVFFFSKKKEFIRSKKIDLRDDWLSHIIPIIILFFKTIKVKILLKKKFFFKKEVYIYKFIIKNCLIKIIIGQNFIEKKEIFFYKKNKLKRKINFEKKINNLKKGILFLSIKNFYNNIKDYKNNSDDLKLTLIINKFIHSLKK